LTKKAAMTGMCAMAVNCLMLNTSLNRRFDPKTLPTRLLVAAVACAAPGAVDPARS
jgi:hypothetical protein